MPGVNYSNSLSSPINTVVETAGCKYSAVCEQSGARARVAVGEGRGREVF